MNNPDRTSRSGATTDIAVSSIDVHQRLRLAARILANGAIRAALKQQANQEPKHNPAISRTVRQLIAKRPNNADLPDVNNSDIPAPNNEIGAGQFPSVMADKAIGFPADAACNQK